MVVRPWLPFVMPITLFPQLKGLIAMTGQLRWWLTLTYLLVSLAAILVAAWWAVVAVVLCLGQAYADLSWREAFQKMAPVLRAILPSGLLLVLPATLVSAYFGFLSARWHGQAQPIGRGFSRAQHAQNMLAIAPIRTTRSTPNRLFRPFYSTWPTG